MLTLSIIIPVYNVVTYLPVCLESIFRQTGFFLDVILVDDASTDGSAALCATWLQRYPDHIRLLTHTENRGLSAARNTGLAHARGEYLTFVDSDDYLAPGTWAAMAAILAHHPETDLLEFPVSVYHGSARAYGYRPTESADAAEDLAAWRARGGYLHSYAWNKIYHRRLWEGTVFPPGRYFEDMYTVPYVVERARHPRVTSCGLYFYCSRDTSITGTISCRKEGDLLTANQNYYTHLLRQPQVPDTVLDDCYLNLCNRQISYLMAGGSMQIPDRRIPWLRVCGRHLPPKVRMKMLLLSLLGRRMCPLIVKLSSLFHS